jgi:hypothetical protein
VYQTVHVRIWGMKDRMFYSVSREIIIQMKEYIIIVKARFTTFILKMECSYNTAQYEKTETENVTSYGNCHWR